VRYFGLGLFPPLCHIPGKLLVTGLNPNSAVILNKFFSLFYQRVDGYQDGELGAFLFGLCCLTLTLLYGLVSHILFSRKEIEVDASVFVAA